MTSPPIRLLYLHAQHSIFTWCSLGDLAFLSRVDRSWRAATASSPSIGAHAWLTEPLPVVAESKLSRHVGEIHNGVSKAVVLLSSAQMSAVSARMPHLRRLACSLYLSDSAPIAFPASLTILRVDVWSSASHSHGSAPNCTVVIQALPSLPHLRALFISAAGVTADLSLEPLQRCGALRDLSLHCVGLHDQHIEQLRQLKQLECFASIDLTRLLPRLLRPPHNLQWMCIDSTSCSMDLYPGVSDALASMTTLTKLDLHYHSVGSPGASPDLAFLGTQKALASLRIRYDQDAAFSPIFLEGLRSCRALRTLILHHCCLGDEHLELILAGMVHLTALDLSRISGLISLHCLEQPHLAEKLQSLRLGPITHLRSVDLTPILTLRCLTSLNLMGWLVCQRLDPELAKQLMPPSPALPSLVMFEPTPVKWFRFPDAPPAEN